MQPDTAPSRRSARERGMPWWGGVGWGVEDRREEEGVGGQEDGYKTTKAIITFLL